MKTNTYVSIDIETTSLDPETGQIIEFAIIQDDLDKPLMPREEMRNHLGIDVGRACWNIVNNEHLMGSFAAIDFNKDLIARLISGNAKYNVLNSVSDLDFLLTSFKQFCSPNSKMVVAGKNFGGFDKQFLNHYGINCAHLFHHRYIDVGMMFWEFSKDGMMGPSLQECMNRAGFKTTVQHDAFDDAYDVIKLIRYKLGKL